MRLRSRKEIVPRREKPLIGEENGEKENVIPSFTHPPHPSPPWLAVTLPLLVVLFLSGCAAGPDFQRPALPEVQGYGDHPLPTETVGSPETGAPSQRLVTGGDIPAQWWTLFRSPSLDAVITRAIKESPNLAAAQAALITAKENRLAQLGALFPSLDAGFSANRRKFTGASFGQPDVPGGLFTLYNASVSVSYTLDLFGATRRGLEELQAEVDHQRYILEGAYLTLTSNIVTTAVREASLRAQIEATRDIIRDEEEQLALVEEQVRLGAAAMPDLLAQRAQLAQTRATLPPLEKELSRTRHLLAVLAGSPPSAAADLPQFNLSDFTLPDELPVSLPSSLVNQRPDIRAAEEQLHSACALVGVATANLFPKLTITGDYGSQSTMLTGLFSGGTTVWSIGAGLLQPVFRGGELTARRRAAIAAFDQAEALYRDTVLQAFQDVADVLRALEKDAESLKTQSEAETAAAQSLALTRDRFQLGGVGYISLLNAQRQHQQAILTLAQARAARFADTAALFQALGGGWWNRDSGSTSKERNP